MRDSLGVQKGTLDLMVLKTLSWGPAHGYGIARWIEQCTDDALRVEEGSLYPALHRLEERGLVTSEWGLTRRNREAKYYRITAAGRRELRNAYAQWQRFAAALNKVMDSPPRPA